MTSFRLYDVCLWLLWDLIDRLTCQYISFYHAQNVKRGMLLSFDTKAFSPGRHLLVKKATIDGIEA